MTIIKCIEIDSKNHIKVINDAKINRGNEQIALRVERSFLENIKKISMGNISYAICSLADYALNCLIEKKQHLVLKREKSGNVSYELKDFTLEDEYHISITCERSDISNELTRTTIWAYDDFINKIKTHSDSYYTISVLGLVKYGLDLLEKSNKTLFVVKEKQEVLNES